MADRGQHDHNPDIADIFMGTFRIDVFVPIVKEDTAVIDRVAEKVAAHPDMAAGAFSIRDCLTGLDKED